jgi:HEAT repeat protein
MAHSFTQKKVPFEDILVALKDESTPFPPSYIYYFSDLDDKKIQKLQSIWASVNAERKINLLQDLKDLSEAETTTSFENLSRITLYDPDPRVRVAGLKILWDTEDIHHVPKLLDLRTTDKDNLVRASAAEVLGEFVYLGELDKIPSKLHHEIEDALISLFDQTNDPLLRQKIVEALGYSSREEVPNIIRFAYQQKESAWVSSALFAMGRSADKIWEKDVDNSLNSADSEVIIEAVRASGELELETTRETIIKLVKQTRPGEELHTVAVWSLSQIGGDEVRELLEDLLDQTTDEDEIEYLEEALENLNFTQGVQQFRMFNFEKPKKDNFLKEITLEDEVEENSDLNIEDDEDERR